MAKKTKKTKKTTKVVRGFNFEVTNAIIDAVANLTATAKENGAKNARKLITAISKAARKADRALSREIAGAGRREEKRARIADRIKAMKAKMKSM